MTDHENDNYDEALEVISNNRRKVTEHNPTTKIEESIFNRLPHKTEETPSKFNFKNIKPINFDENNAKFGFGSFFFLLTLIWITEWLGAAVPGPIDDLIYGTAASILFGLIQYLRNVFANRKK